jgi:hypothetical protein
VATLPHHHSDPFDRMLITQAMCEQLALVTHDRRFEPSGVELIITRPEQPMASCRRLPRGDRLLVGASTVNIGS